MADDRLLCDAMLGSLARMFRVMGFDTEYVDSGQDDADVVARALDEDRVLVTRDYELSTRARNAGAGAVLVKDLSVDQQLAIVLTHLGMALDPGRFFTRCTVCNGVLKAVQPEEVTGEVPDNVRRRQTEFTRCATCGKVYWPGTHVESLEARLQEVIRQVAGNG